MAVHGRNTGAHRAVVVGGSRSVAREAQAAAEVEGDLDIEVEQTNRGVEGELSVGHQGSLHTRKRERRIVDGSEAGDNNPAGVAGSGEAVSEEVVSVDLNGVTASAGAAGGVERRQVEAGADLVGSSRLVHLDGAVDRELNGDVEFVVSGATREGNGLADNLLVVAASVVHEVQGVRVVAREESAVAERRAASEDLGVDDAEVVQTAASDGDRVAA
mmetsp:Transcript_9271/g.38108  ORF Transcript_9271/g.38108 Transcript_9271/m.38108 type:complete len:216 (-) Transcript_9271:756-1403(-)